MRRPIIDWNDNDFLTRIDGMEFRIIAERRSTVYYKATAYIPSYTHEDNYCDEFVSSESVEDAILGLVKKIEKYVG